METTSLDDALPATVTRERGHIHLQDVVDHAEEFAANEVCTARVALLYLLYKSWFLLKAVMLMHFSRRYKAAEIKEKLQAALPASLHAKVHAAIGDFFTSTTHDGVE